MEPVYTFRDGRMCTVLASRDGKNVHRSCLSHRGNRRGWESPVLVREAEVCVPNVALSARFSSECGIQAGGDGGSEQCRKA